MNINSLIQNERINNHTNLENNNMNEEQKKRKIFSLENSADLLNNDNNINQEHLSKKLKLNNNLTNVIDNSNELKKKDDKNIANQNSINKDKLMENEKFYNNPYYPTYLEFVKEINNLRKMVEEVKRIVDINEIKNYQENIKIKETKFKNFKKNYPETFAIFTRQPYLASSSSTKSLSLPNSNQSTPTKDKSVSTSFENLSKGIENNKTFISTPTDNNTNSNVNSVIKEKNQNSLRENSSNSLSSITNSNVNILSEKNINTSSNNSSISVIPKYTLNNIDSTKFNNNNNTNKNIFSAENSMSNIASYTTTINTNMNFSNPSTGKINLQQQTAVPIVNIIDPSKFKPIIYPNQKVSFRKMSNYELKFNHQRKNDHSSINAQPATLTSLVNDNLKANSSSTINSSFQNTVLPEKQNPFQIINSPSTHRSNSTSVISNINEQNYNSVPSNPFNIHQIESTVPSDSTKKNSYIQVQSNASSLVQPVVSSNEALDKVRLVSNVLSTNNSSALPTISNPNNTTINLNLNSTLSNTDASKTKYVNPHLLNIKDSTSSTEVLDTIIIDDEDTNQPNNNNTNSNNNNNIATKPSHTSPITNNNYTSFDKNTNHNKDKSNIDDNNDNNNSNSTETIKNDKRIKIFNFKRLNDSDDSLDLIQVQLDFLKALDSSQNNVFVDENKDTNNDKSMNNNNNKKSNNEENTLTGNTNYDKDNHKGNKEKDIINDSDSNKKSTLNDKKNTKNKDNHNDIDNFIDLDVLNTDYLPDALTILKNIVNKDNDKNNKNISVISDNNKNNNNNNNENREFDPISSFTTINDNDSNKLSDKINLSNQSKDLNENKNKNKNNNNINDDKNGNADNNNNNDMNDKNNENNNIIITPAVDNNHKNNMNDKNNDKNNENNNNIITPAVNTNINKDSKENKEQSIKSKEEEKQRNEKEIESNINTSNKKFKFTDYSRNYKEHVIRLNMKKLIRKGYNFSVTNGEIKIDQTLDLFSDSTMELIEKSLDVIKEYFVKIPKPFDMMKDPYIKIYHLLNFTISTEQELKDIDHLTRVLFNFLLDCRIEIQNSIQYCCKKLNKRPLIYIPINNNLKVTREKFKNLSEQDFLVTSNILDYQWTAVEFLLQRLDRNYCAFRIRNKHVLPQSKLI